MLQRNLPAAAMLLTLLVGSAATPVAGHGVTEALEIETQLLQDEGIDGFGVIDGLDLWDLYIRDAHWLGEDGVIFRMQLYGGPSYVLPAGDYRIDITYTTTAGERVVSFATQDAMEWTSEDGVIIEPSASPDPFVLYDIALQFFVSYERLGAMPGDDISAVTMTSWAGSNKVDVAPGGFYVAGAAEAEPEESLRLVETHRLLGPWGYLTTELAPAEGGWALVVKNLLNTTGQHIHLVIPDTAGWSITSDVPEATVQEKGNTSFILGIAAEPGAAPLTLWITSDIGGVDMWTLAARGGEIRAVQGVGIPLFEDAGPAEEAGASAIAALLAAVVGLALLMRRRM